MEDKNHNEDLVCSEVNTFSREVEKDGSCETGFRVASFLFTLPSSLSIVQQQGKSAWFCRGTVCNSGLRRTRSHPAIGSESDDEDDIEVPRFQSLDYGELEDSDGDLEVTRTYQRKEETVRLEHRLTTDLAHVGLQLWKGSLLLADYILHHHKQFTGQRVLEVGSGTGLASIIAARCGASVLATDLADSDVQNLINRNVTRNKDLLIGNIEVTELDFKDDLSRNCKLDNVEIVLAGDIIYDDNITDSFVEFLLRLRNLTSSPRVLVSLEKRFVFTVADLDTRAPAYEHFMKRLGELSDKVIVKRVDIEFEQYFCYERSAELVMLDLKFVKDCSY